MAEFVEKPKSAGGHTGYEFRTAVGQDKPEGEHVLTELVMTLSGAAPGPTGPHLFLEEGEQVDGPSVTNFGGLWVADERVDEVREWLDQNGHTIV